jgi:TPR repeat protein
MVLQPDKGKIPARCAGVKGRNAMAYSDIPVEPGALIGAHSLPDDLYRAGLAFATGTGTEINLIEAHKWFNLAAVRGHEEAKIQRQEMAEMLTSAEIKMALQAARDWLKLAN